MNINTRLDATCALLALVLCATNVNAQVTTTMSSTTVKSSTEQPVVISSDARHAFELSMQANPLPSTQASPPMVALSWQAFPTASSYVLLRGSLPGGPYVAIPVRDALSFPARYLPGYNFFFRVVALNSRGAALDTTSAIRFAMPGFEPDMDGAAAVNRIALTCNTTVPSGVTLSWHKPAGVDDAIVHLAMPNNATMGAGGNSVQTGTSFSQTGLPAGPYQVTVAVRYTLDDYPSPGQSTSVTLGQAANGFTLPVATAGPCH